MPNINTLTDVYTVGAATQSIVSSIMVCNTGSIDSTVRISAAINGAADTGSQYIYYNLPLPIAETYAGTLGITLSPGDKIRAFVTTGSVSVNLFGVEIT